MLFLSAWQYLAIINAEGTKGYKQFWLLQLQQNYRRTTFVEKTGGKILEVGVKYLIGDTLKVSWWANKDRAADNKTRTVTDLSKSFGALDLYQTVQGRIRQS